MLDLAQGHHASRTFVSRMTAALPAGIATLQIVGDQAEAITLQCFNLSSNHLKIGRVYYGTWNAENRRSNDPHAEASLAEEQVVVCRTTTDRVDIHGHGGRAVCNRLIESLCQAGATQIPASEMLALTSPTTIATATAQTLLQAKTDRAAGILLDQHNGKLQSAFEQLLDDLIRHDTTAAIHRLQSISRWNHFAERLVAGWQIVLAGPPNVGKSSLLNAIAGSTHSIVHSEAGTTRDWVQVETAVDGWPILLSDTAGIRAAENDIERQGIAFARKQIEQADVVLFVVDAEVGWTDTHRELAQSVHCAHITVLNKSDLLPAASTPQTLGLPADTILSSCQTNAGLPKLLARLAQVMVPKLLPTDSALAITPDLRAALSEISALIHAGQFKETQEMISRLTTNAALR